MDIITPVIESAVVMAAEYAKACGRDYIHSKDMEYAMKFAAMNITGKHIGTLFPEHSDDDQEEEPELDVVEESPEDFTRYEGDSEILQAVNSAYDNWAEWEPTNPIEKILKSSIYSS